MNLYLDDNSAKPSLVAALRKAGHQVALAANVGRSTTTDPQHLTHCALQGLVLLTKDHDDFEDLHNLVQATQGRHAGLLVVRSDNDPSRDMKDRDIARAIANLEAAGVPTANEFHSLNHWR
jgi:predicted nuclease of predicted toxin-antitoxin system